MKSLFEQYREELQDTTYCCYCLELQGEKWHCCKENHFSLFQDLDFEDQKEMINWEIQWAEEASKKVELANGR
jgi:hypothetical protein